MSFFKKKKKLAPKLVLVPGLPHSKVHNLAFVQHWKGCWEEHHDCAKHLLRRLFMAGVNYTQVVRLMPPAYVNKRHTKAHAMSMAELLGALGEVEYPGITAIYIEDAADA